MTIISPIGSSFTATTGREPSEDPLALTAVQDEDLDQYGDEDAEGEEDDGVEYTAEDLVNMAEDGEMNGGESGDEDRKRVQFRRETRAAKVREKKAQKKGTVQESAHQRQYGPEEVGCWQLSVLEQPSDLAGRYTQGGMGKQELIPHGQGSFRRGAGEAARSGIQGAFARCAQVSVRPIAAAMESRLC